MKRKARQALPLSLLFAESRQLMQVEEVASLGQGKAVTLAPVVVVRTMLSFDHSIQCQHRGVVFVEEIGG